MKTMLGSRLSLHCDMPPPEWALKQLVRGKVSSILIHAAPSIEEAAQAVKYLVKHLPDIKIVWRDIRYEGYWKTGADGAERWMSIMEKFVQMFTPEELDHLYFMGMNEWGDTGYNAEQRIALAPTICDFEIARSDKLRERGTHACVFNFSMGTPGLKKYNDPEEWHLYKDALKYFAKKGEVVGVHEYYWAGSPLEQPWITGRIIDALVELGLSEEETPMFAIAEFGYGRQHENVGWQKDKTEQQYLDELISVDQTIYNIPKIVGVMVYLYLPNNRETWESFNLKDPLIEKMMDYTLANSEMVPVPGTEPDPEPDPEPEPIPEPEFTSVTTEPGWLFDHQRELRFRRGKPLAKGSKVRILDSLLLHKIEDETGRVGWIFVPLEEIE